MAAPPLHVFFDGQRRGQRVVWVENSATRLTDISVGCREERQSLQQRTDPASADEGYFNTQSSQRREKLDGAAADDPTSTTGGGR